MSIAFDNAVDGLKTLAGTSLTFNFTMGSVSSGLLLIPFAGDVVGGNDDITSVTFNSVSATLLQKFSGTGADRILYVYGLLAPASGMHQVAINWTNVHLVQGGASSYSGVKQSGLPDAVQTNVSTTSATSLTTNITTVSDNDWLFCLEGGYSGDAGDPTAGTGATRRTHDATDGGWGAFDSNGAKSPAGSYSIQTNRSGNPFSLAIAHIVLAPAPDTGAAPSPRLLTLLGVGA